MFTPRKRYSVCFLFFLTQKIIFKGIFNVYQKSLKTYWCRKYNSYIKFVKPKYKSLYILQYINCIQCSIQIIYSADGYLGDCIFNYCNLVRVVRGQELGIQCISFSTGRQKSPPCTFKSPKDHLHQGQFVLL